jgi:hypothetical protein
MFPKEKILYNPKFYRNVLSELDDDTANFTRIANIKENLENTSSL